jgi:hypothetical protein
MRWTIAIRFPTSVGSFPFTNLPRAVLGPTQPLSKRQQGLFLWRLNWLGRHLLPRLRMRGLMNGLTFIPRRSGERIVSVAVAEKRYLVHWGTHECLSSLSLQCLAFPSSVWKGTLGLFLIRHPLVPAQTRISLNYAINLYTWKCSCQDLSYSCALPITDSRNSPSSSP